MLTSQKTMLVLGGSGFIGHYVIQEAVKAGWHVKALVRSDDAAELVAARGATPFRGDAKRPDEWIAEARGARAIVDLAQARHRKRVGRQHLRAAASERLGFTEALVTSLRAFNSRQQASEQQAMLISVSGIDDLGPDDDGRLSARSPLREDDYGFSPVGVPVRKMLQQSGIKVACVGLGTVYGPGKAFADAIFPQLAKGKWKNFGQDMALIHVQDAARALVHIAGMESDAIAGKSFVLTDGAPVTMDAFFGLAARHLGVAAPGSVPRWLAALVAGRALVDTMLYDLPVTSSIPGFADFQLTFPSYREGVPATLTALGYMKT